MNIDTKWYQLSVEEVLAKLSSTITGLTDEEAEKRLDEFGPNQLVTRKPESLFIIFLRQFQSPLIYILLIAAIISFFFGKMSNVAVIFAVLMVNAIMGFIQESRAAKSMESLKELAAPKAKVLREGRHMEISTRNIVPGDVILLESGTKISADARVIESIRLQVNEASLTGESLPVFKISDSIKADTGLSDRINTVYSGTIVVSGRAKAVVVATGMNTEIGKIAEIIQTTPEPKTPFQRKMEGLGKIIIIVVVIQITLAFSIGYFLRGMNFYDIFMVALSQMVSSIPEGLPVAVTVALAVGMQRMAKRKAYIRKLAAVEGLGSATVICSDKTGTLTRNEMTSKRMATIDKEIEIPGVGYNINNPIDLENEDDIKHLLKIAALSNNAYAEKLSEKSTELKVDGDPTEIAYLVLAMKGGIDLEHLEIHYPRLDEIPFESQLQMMLTKHEASEGKHIICVKGAPEKIIEFCGFYIQDGKISPLTDPLRKNLLDKSESLAKEALRVLGFGFLETETKNVEPKAKSRFIGDEKLDIASLKDKLVFIGLIGNIDPPREEVKEAIKLCQKAGIRTMMITGDHLSTAEAVAIELDIQKKEQKGITGDVLNFMTDEELDSVVQNFNVFARIEPKHKFRIVQSLQRQNEVVAMTGDGINDAPAIASADIGVAMGIIGTDIAKEASDMVIADDNFATIVNAVEEGRGITANMRKTLLYLLCASNTEILTLLTALSVGSDLPLLPLQILWINLVTEGALTVNLIMEPKEEDVMHQPPDKKNEPIITKHLLKLLLFRSPIMAAGIIGLFLYEITRGQGLLYARTVTFTTLAFTQWVNGINCRSEKKSIFKMPFFSNKYLIAGLTVGIILHLSVLYVPFLQQLFSTTPISLTDWLKIVLVGSTIFWAEEIRKYVAGRVKNESEVC